MITNTIVFKQRQVDHIATFDNTATHWDGRCAERVALRIAIRKHYLKEQNRQCPYCHRLRQDTHGYCWDIDHIIPKSTYPIFTYEPRNFAVTCKECNRSKDKLNVLSPTATIDSNYPQSKDDYIIIHPHLDEYTENMKVSYTRDLKIYHTPLKDKGRETFRICGLNRFTEEVAGTSEYIAETETVIGFDDDKYRDLYEGFMEYVSLFNSKPEIQARLFADFLARKNGLETENVISVIRALANDAHYSSLESLPSLGSTLSLPPPAQPDDY